MCLNHDLTTTELRALLSDAIATAKCTSGHMDDALHAMLATPSSAPAAVSPGSESAPVPAGAGDPHPQEQSS